VTGAKTLKILRMSVCQRSEQKRRRRMVTWSVWRKSLWRPWSAQKLLWSVQKRLQKEGLQGAWCRWWAGVLTPVAVEETDGGVQVIYYWCKCV
jgi:hypothetical protein